MCGILGCNFETKNDFKDIVSILNNRGPDNQAIKKIAQNSFAHTRLSIIDLDNEANQPMVFDDILIVFNGEIYNYDELKLSENLKCKTSSDTEVLIRLFQKYNTEFLNLLNGAFSFCIFDIKKDRYFCARDRYGKKPFYYYFKDGKFIFSSMIKPIIKILGFTPALNKTALSEYLQYFTPLAPNTFYEAIQKLDKASYLVFEKGKLNLKKYYKIKTYKAIKDEKTALEKIEDLLIDSVKQRLKSDVEVGTLLSGGIDSSLITSIYAKNTNQPINSFSVGYKTHTKYSELPYASLATKYINANHTVLEIGKEEYIDSLDEVLENLEEPHADPAAIPLFHLTKQIKKQGIKTVLSGEGSDELFLGYDNYAKFLKYHNFSNTLTNEQYGFLDGIIGGLQTGSKESELFRRLVKKQNLYNGFGELFTDIEKKKLLKKYINLKQESIKNDFVDHMSYIDMKIWLGEALLSKVDKMCMANSVENRNPFLDYRLVDTLFSIDSDIKVGDTNKYLLKKIAKKYIPKEIIGRSKKGFNSPFNEWLFSEYDKKLIEDIIYVNKNTNLFKEEFVTYLFNEAKENRFKQHFYALWLFCKWYKKVYL